MRATQQRRAALGLVDEGVLFAAAQAGATLPLTRPDRARIGGLIETLIALLDHDDGDPDMEDGDLDRCTAGEDGPKVDAAFDHLWRNAA